MSDIEPGEARLAAFLAHDAEKPVALLNLLKFRPQADYAPGHNEPARTGAEAYAVYGVTARQAIEEAGGTILMGGLGEDLIGSHGEWDMVVLVYYPSRTAFVEMVQRPFYRAALHHRTAGLAATRLIPLAVGGPLDAAIRSGLLNR